MDNQGFNSSGAIVYSFWGQKAITGAIETMEPDSLATISRYVHVLPDQCTSHFIIL